MCERWQREPLVSLRIPCFLHLCFRRPRGDLRNWAFLGTVRVFAWISEYIQMGLEAAIHFCESHWTIWIYRIFPVFIPFGCQCLENVSKENMIKWQIRFINPEGKYIYTLFFSIIMYMLKLFLQNHLFITFVWMYLTRCFVFCVRKLPEAGYLIVNIWGNSEEFRIKNRQSTGIKEFKHETIFKNIKLISELVNKVAFQISKDMSCVYVYI